jgi:hypothetical protein
LILVIETTGGLTSTLSVVIEIGYVTPRLSRIAIHGGDEGDHMWYGAQHLEKKIRLFVLLVKTY